MSGNAIALFAVNMYRADLGFTAVELLIVVAIAGVVATMSVPSLTGAMQRDALNGARQTVGAEIRLARFTAVSTSRTMRVRFNCPGPDQFRVVEVVGLQGIDSSADRCSEASYPFPDQQPGVQPDADGRVLLLPKGAQFGGLHDLEITPRGRVMPLTGCPGCAQAAPPATVSLTNGYDTRTIAVSASGRVELPE